MSYKATAWAYDMPISGSQKPVLVALADMADEAGSCFPGQQKIAQMTGLSVRTVARALERLEARGLLKRERRVDARGHRTSDRYYLQLTVSLPETLPDTVPTRQSAYKAECPSLPDTVSIPTGHSVRGTTRRTTREPSGGRANALPAPWRCEIHQDRKARGGCTDCGDARREHDYAQKLAREAEQSKPTPIPPRHDDVECAPESHKWLADGTCMLCTARKAVVA